MISAFFGEGTRLHISLVMIRELEVEVEVRLGKGDWLSGLIVGL